MRLPAWLALTGTVCMLLAVGALAVNMNQAALETAERVYRTDAVALAVNNRSLIDQYVRQSAQELAQTLVGYTPTLVPDNPDDLEVLTRLVGRTAFFRFGAAFTDLDGQVRTLAVGMRALPGSDDPGFATLFGEVAKGGMGVSGVLQGQDTPVIAIGVPVMLDGAVRGALLGFSNLRTSLLQGFILQLSDGGGKVGIIDSRGVTIADTDQMQIASRVNPKIASTRLEANGAAKIFEFIDDGREMVGVVVPGSRGGWAFYQAKPISEFYGPARSRSTQLTLVVLVLVLFAAISLTFLGYRVTAAQRRAETRFTALVQNATDLITVLNADGAITYDSPSVSAALGIEREARLGKRLLASVHPEDRPIVGLRLRELQLHPGGIDRFECRVRRADFTYLWCDMSASNLLHEPAIRGIVVNGRDVSDRRRLQEQLSYQAQHDGLTGLPNRQVFADRLRVATTSGRLIAVLFVDLDRFKWVNDRWGHDVGDDLLRRVASRLARCIRSRDTLARVGGDEFVILLDGIEQEHVALDVAERIVTAMSRPFRMPSAAVRIGASVGISTNASQLSTATADSEMRKGSRAAGPAIGAEDLVRAADDLVRAADSAMYRAKQAGGLSYRIASTPASA